jgi:type III secretion system-like peptide-binding chaperone/uncharacterized protein DUF6794
MTKSTRKSTKPAPGKPTANAASRSRSPMELGPDKWPTALEAAVGDLVEVLPPGLKEEVRKAEKADLVRFHFGLGSFIRNRHGLWRGNKKLILSAAKSIGRPPDLVFHPDSASSVIIEALWTLLRTRADSQKPVTAPPEMAPENSVTPVRPGDEAEAAPGRLALSEPQMPRQPSTAMAWDEFAERLAFALADLDEGDYLVVSIKRSHRYVQFKAQGAFGMRAESVSDAFLGDKEKLTEADCTALLKMGWRPPTRLPKDMGQDSDGSLNYYMDLAQPVQYGNLADIAATTLRHVLKARHPGALEYKAHSEGGDSIRFPSLGIRRVISSSECDW